MQCIDIFSGGGIGALGYQRAGFEHRLFVEWDPWATMTLQANYPGVSIDNRNLFLYSMAEVFEDHGIAIDFEGLIAMSPPCQGHSTAGTQGGREDLRNSLLGKVVEAAEYAPQAWIVMENVKGLTAGTSADLLVELESALLDLGRRPFRWILDAKEYGVPSSRPRLFLLIPPLFRVPTQFWDEYPPSPPEKHKELVTTREAIGKTFVDLDPEFREMSENEVVLYSGIGPSQNWTASEFGRLYGALKEHGPTSDLLRRPTWDAPYPCVLTGRDGSTVGCIKRVSLIHPIENRYLSVGECKRLLNIPQEYLLAGPLVERQRQIGNCVAPDIAELVGKAVISMNSNIPAKGD